MTTRLLWLAGGLQAAIVIANFALPGKLDIRHRVGSLPLFIRQMFYVHWLYIVLIVGLFSSLCFAFARELAGATPLGRFLSMFIGAFWLLRIGLQWFYYDPAIRREHRGLDAAYGVALVMLATVMGWVVLNPIP